MGNGSSYVNTTEQSKQSSGYVKVYSQLINMGFDEDISLKAATLHPNNINKAVTYVHDHHIPTQNDNNDSKVDLSIVSVSKSDFEDFQLPVFIKIPNHTNDDAEYKDIEHSFPISQKVFEEGRVLDLIMAATAILNQKMSASGTSYQIINPDQEMISKSFCDVTSHDQQLRFIKEFDKNDVLTKGLHLSADIIGSDPSVITCQHNDTQSKSNMDEEFTVPIFIEIPNGANQEYQLPLTNDKRMQIRVIDLLETSVELVNRKVKASDGTRYQIMNPDQEMILKSFCDITSHDEQLKYLNQFNTDDIINKGLHLICNIMDDHQAQDDNSNQDKI